MIRTHPGSIAVFFFFALLSSTTVAQKTGQSVPASAAIGSINKDVALRLASFPLKCIRQQYPNKPSNIMERDSDRLTPQQMHPSFYGCFDWHSSVHGHWMLVRLLKNYPDLAVADTIRMVLNQSLSAENLAKEQQYFSLTINASFERMYGWAWLLKLAEELHTWNDPDARKWEQNLEPLTQIIIQRIKSFLPKQNYPIRQGMHPNTAFALAFIYDYAAATGNDSLKAVIVTRSKDYFVKDVNAQLEWEPSGSDFLSPALEEADLMRRVLNKAEYVKWIHAFFPTILQKKPVNILKSVKVLDRTDLQLVHLDGLNISRAWCLAGIAQSVGVADPLHKLFMQSATEQLATAMPTISSGNYGGEHWLASFMLYALEVMGQKNFR